MIAIIILASVMNMFFIAYNANKIRTCKNANNVEYVSSLFFMLLHFFFLVINLLSLSKI